MRTHDSLGRALPNHCAPIDEIFTLKEVDIFGTLEPLNVHGELYTPYLSAFGSYYRACDTNKRVSRLARGKVRYQGDVGAPVLTRPKDQFPQDRQWISRNMTLRYGLAPRGQAILESAGRYHDIKHGGWKTHQIANACITASLHLGALKDGKPFMPLAPPAVKVPFEIKGREYENVLLPDCLFAADRYYAVETDLGNEVGRAEEPHRRKTYERMVIQYVTLIGDRLYHEAYKIPANKPLLVLFVSTSKSKLDLLEGIIKEQVGACNFILMRHVPAEAFSAYHSPKPMYDLWTEPWKRAGRSEFYIDNPGRQ